MVFAGQKLRRHPALNNPTVLIVVDRRDLKTQLSDDFDACDYPNVEKALGVEDLKAKLRATGAGRWSPRSSRSSRWATSRRSQRDNIISLVDEAHRSQKGKGTESYAMTMRVKLANGFRFGFTGTPIDRTMQNTHRDFGPVKDGVQERYLSYYGIRRAIKDGATLEVHYIRDRVPFKVDEKPLSVGFEQMCEEMELEDEEAKDFVQRQRAQWKEIATPSRPHRHRARQDARPLPGASRSERLQGAARRRGPQGLRALQGRPRCEACRRAACRPNGPTSSSRARRTASPRSSSFEYAKQKQDELIDYFKLTPAEWERWNRERYGEDRSKWRPPLEDPDRLRSPLTGFDAPVEQVMYLDKPLRDHNLLQAIARTNRPLPAMKKRTGVVVDYFGVFANLEKALNFDENIREESLIDWDALRATVPGEVARCMELFEGITIEDTRECLLAALRRLRDPDAAKNFEHNFKSLERLWEAVAPDPCLYPHRYQYNWLCGDLRRTPAAAARQQGYLW